jgi:hypothetical protein
MVTRRNFLSGSAAVLALGSMPVRAQGAGSLTIVSHKVHQDVTKGPVYAAG